MIHIRIDDEEHSGKRRFACCLGPTLPPGDTYYFQNEWGADYVADCPGCNPGGPKKIGTPLSELSGRPGHDGYAEWLRISKSWGMP